MSTDDGDGPIATDPALLLRPDFRPDGRDGPDPAGGAAAGSASAPKPVTARRVGPPRPVVFTLGALALVASMALALPIGVDGVGYPEVYDIFTARLGLAPHTTPVLLESLVWDLRLPRVLMAALVGAGLAVCGATLQAVTRNSLADPYLLGVSSGASTGAVAVVVLGLGGGALSVTGGAFTGALLSFGLLLLLLRRGGLRPIRIVLTGVVVGQLFSALTSLIIMASGDADATRALTHWLLGSLASARWDGVVICAVATVVGTVVVWGLSASLDGFSFGTDTAASLGINVTATRIVLLVTTALLTSVAVASVGAIGFVGLIVPHAIRFLIGPLHRALLPAAALTGAVFLVWTDVLSREVFAPRAVPVGVFTALVGVPLFLIILRKRGEL